MAECTVTAWTITPQKVTASLLTKTVWVIAALKVVVGERAPFCLATATRLFNEATHVWLVYGNSRAAPICFRGVIVKTFGRVARVETGLAVLARINLEKFWKIIILVNWSRGATKKARGIRRW